MPRLPLVSTPPSIAIAAEPLDDAATSAAASLVWTEGFEVVPAWRARSPHRVRRLAPAAVIAAGVVAAVVIGHGHDARALRERSAAVAGGNGGLVQPLVVSAGGRGGAVSSERPMSARKCRDVSASGRAGGRVC